MAEIKNYTMNSAFDMTRLRQVSLRRATPRSRLVVGPGHDCCGPKFVGACRG